MDPTLLAERDWQGISQAVGYLWLFVGAMIVGLGLLWGQVLAGSLVSTRHLSPGLLRARPLFLLLGGASLMVGALFLARAIAQALSLLHFYPRFWM